MAFGTFLRAAVGPPPSPAGDAGPLARFLSDRDEAAFAALVNRHGPVVLGVCKRLLGNHHDAEDAAQAVFVVLARKAGSIHKRQDVAAWLHGVTVRVCRKALARRKPTLPLAAEPAVEPTWQDGLRTIDEALATLPDQLREPLVLCHLHGLTRDEAAAHLGLSESTLRGRLDRGKERLRRELERRGFPLAVGLIGTALTTNPLPAATTAAILELALGLRPLPETVHALTHGVTPMRHLKYWIAGGVAVGLLAVGGGWLYLQPTARADPFTQLAKPDVKAGRVPAKLDGTWAAAVSVEGGRLRRDTRLKFVDDTHLVWELTQTQSDLPAPQVITLKMKYEITKDGELRMDVLEKWFGEDKMAKLSEADQKPRVYSMTWDKDGKGFTLKTVPASDSPWATLTFARGEEKAKPAADPLVPEALTKIDRKIAKRPKFAAEKPGYCLLAFGPDAGFRAWVVLDGDKLYVDRNGNGDLTDDEAVAFRPGESTPPKAYVFEVGGIGDAKQEKKYKLNVSTLAVGASQPAAVFVVTRDGAPVQKVGPTDFRFTDNPADARVIHVGSAVLAVRPSLTMPGVLDAARAEDFRVQVGTPGVGAGSFASVGNDGLAKGVYPVAEFTFQSAKLGDKPVVRTVELKERCCGDQFFAEVEVPKDTVGDRAAVTIRFPNYPHGSVTPFTGEVPVNRKK